MFPKPLLAASFEPLVLAMLANGSTYGYEIIQRIQELSGGRIAWATNRLYPLLHNLENQGLVTTSWQHAGPGPGRKYYDLTAKGNRALARAKHDWLDLSAILTSLWGPSLSPTT